MIGNAAGMAKTVSVSKYWMANPFADTIYYYSRHYRRKTAHP
jgi:hypothetical protein